MSDTLSITTAKSRLCELVSRVGKQHDRATITVHGQPLAILVSPQELESLEETIAVLSDSHALAQIAESTADIAQGHIEAETDLAAAMTSRRGSKCW